MTELVTTAEARMQLRADTADDPWIEFWNPIVSAAVLGWLKDEWRAYEPEIGPDGLPVEDSNGDPIPAVDSNGQMTPRQQAKGAVVLELASMFRFREGEGKDNVVPPDAGHGYVLNKTSTALLTPLRKSTIA